MNPRPYALAGATLCALFATSDALANPINAEALRPKSAQEGLSVGADLTFAMRTGNVEFIDVSAGGIIQYQTHRPRSEWADTSDDAPPVVDQTVFLNANVRYAQRAEDAFVNQGFVHARWTSMWLPRVGTEVFAQHSFNAFQLLQARTLGGVGVRLDMVETPSFKLWGGSGYMLEYNLITVPEGAPDDPEDLQNRWTNYFTVRARLFDGELLLQNTFYVQPRLTNFNDVRLLEVFEALAPITDRIALGVSFSLLHDSMPPTSVEPTDTTLSTTLKFSF
jgi:hypothetical protein